MKRLDFLRTTLLAPLAGLFGWEIAPHRYKVTNARMFINGVEVPLQGSPSFNFPPRYEGDRAVIVGEWTGDMSFEASLVEPIDAQTWHHVFYGEEE